MTDSKMTAAHRRQRVIGAIVGSAVGDALGAPFEFGRPGEFSARFPAPARGLDTEMCGSSMWLPGEWTDDTQMALMIAGSLIDNDGLDEAEVFERFKAWASAGPKDIGIQTQQVLRSGDSWDTAAAKHFAAGHRAAGNGSLMRTVPAAIWFSRFGVDVTVDAARRISDLTHGDPAAGDACAIYHRLMLAALDGADPLTVLDEAIAEVGDERRSKWVTYLGPSWTPTDATEGNGAVWPTLATTVWALRGGWSFEEAMRRVIDIGGDTDTIACVAGGLLGAVQSIQAIPSRWSTPINGSVPGHQSMPDDLASLMDVALRLDGSSTSLTSQSLSDGIDPVEVLPGLWLSDLAGAVRGPEDAVIVSLCRTFDQIKHQHRRQVYLTDDDNNLDPVAAVSDVIGMLEAFQSEGRPALVHCFGGASRTGLVLRAWLRHSRGLDAAAATAEAVRLWPHTAGWNDSFDVALESMNA